MSKTIKDTDTVYKKARIKASEFNDKVKSRESTSEILGVSVGSLLNYEVGVCKQIPVDVVVKMADVYNAPELMNYYCCNECAIGKLTATKIEVLEIDRVTIKVLASLKNIENIKSTLIDIVDDGIITYDEKPKLEYIINALEKISIEANELKIWAQKNLK